MLKLKTKALKHGLLLGMSWLTYMASLFQHYILCPLCTITNLSLPPLSLEIKKYVLQDLINVAIFITSHYNTRNACSCTPSYSLGQKSSVALEKKAFSFPYFEGRSNRNMGPSRTAATKTKAHAPRRTKKKFFA